MRTIRVKLKEYLKENDLSAYRLGKEVEGVKPGTVYNIAAGRNRPSMEALERIMAALENLTGKPVNISDLLEYKRKGKDNG